MRFTIGDLKAVGRLINARQIMKKRNFRVVEEYQRASDAALSKLPHRTTDGSGNSVRISSLGTVGRAFMRNTPTQDATDLPQNPDPRVVSTRLLATPPGQRQALSETVNLLSVAWLHPLLRNRPWESSYVYAFRSREL